ncbi:hypothetical protein K6119_06285 [Paracrocinitomix mangrovi]|uniref:hypothetical protein n=1 Tax=Paracrocinitomix mangrovi TaxID=2862509 RepID=UPI001C8D8111|nr:hypothetical protein [Paracrocinitomix mangrovi]UKN03120.1 hypothetical protein K6119_06285 [Paracrocinitomix mangrovi]
MFIPLFGWAQDQTDKVLTGFGVEAAFNLLDEPTLSFTEYGKVINNPEFFLHSSDAELIASSTLFTRNGINARMIFKGPDLSNMGAFKRSKFDLGVGYNGGNNYAFEFRDKITVRSDTLTLTSSTGSIETLYRDTIFYHSTVYSASSKNISVFGEYLIFLGDKNPGFGVGLGAAFDMTLYNHAQVRHTISYETGLYDENGVLSYAEVESYSGSNNGYYAPAITQIYSNTVEQEVKMAYFIRPYIPVRIETPLSNLPALSKFTVDINAKIGTEVQINPRASVNARMFYSLGIGLNYYM